jgi:hypothetical protein
MTTFSVSDSSDAVSLDHELAALLAHFSDVQDQVLAALTRKRELLVRGDSDGLAEAGQEELFLVEKLEACQAWRNRLLQQAASGGISATDLRSLSSHLSGERSAGLKTRLRETEARFRLLHHHSLTNWVLAQRTVLHLAQILEIIATGGRLEPTYTRGEKPVAHGALVDQAV